MLDFNWPKIKLGLKRFPHQQSCSHFYVVDANGDYALKECPKEQTFDYITLTCRRNTLAQCWSNMLDPGYKPASIPEPFKCPFAWGTYPDITDCSKYFTCHIGVAHHKKCPPSKRFDKVQETCISERKAMCADESDMVEAKFNCPYTWGAFSFNKDCSKYYECFNGKPVLRTCRLGDLFDAIEKICDRKEDVDCGTRYNPYADTKLSTSDLMTSEETKEVETVLGMSSKLPGFSSIKPESLVDKTMKTDTENSTGSWHEASRQEASKASKVQSTEISARRAYESTKQEASASSALQSSKTSARRDYKTKKPEVVSTSVIQNTEASAGGANKATNPEALITTTVLSSEASAKRVDKNKKPEISAIVQSIDTSESKAHETPKPEALIGSTFLSTLGSYENTVSKAIYTNSIDKNVSNSEEFVPTNKIVKDEKTRSQVLTTKSQNNHSER